MSVFLAKMSISYRFILRVLVELIIDIYFYYTSSYTLLLVIGAFKRIKRRLKYLWWPKGPGRPPVLENIVNLILDMKRSNLLWGALRISQELGLLGISLHKKTVAKILRENGFTTPPMTCWPPTWEALLVESREIWAMDFCNIIDLKIFQIYIIGIIDISNREVIYHAVTTHPDRRWIIQQFKNICIEEYEFPEYLIIDNDGIYGKWIDTIFLKYFGIKTLRIMPKCPWQNGIIEKYWGSLQREMINRLHLQDELSIKYFCKLYRSYYNKIRPHQGLGGQTPLRNKNRKSTILDLKTVKYEKIKHVHGLFTEFKIAA